MASDVVEYRKAYPTKAEAMAYREGVLSVAAQGCEITVTEPVQEGRAWVVYITVTEED